VGKIGGMFYVKGAMINFIAIVLGSGLGLVLRMGISESYKKTIMQAMGLAVLFIGFKMALASENSVIVVLSLGLGALLGEMADLEGKLNRFGELLTQIIGSRFGNVGKGFVTATLVFCIGAMAIVGSIQEGLTGDASIIYAKSLIDGIVAVIFAASMGIGVMLSAVSVFLYQGGITLAASVLQNFVTDGMIHEISGTGGIMIVAIGLSMLKIIKIKLANLLPGLPLAAILVWLGCF
jgi:uncharacterized membrane protein YqgA involved in biofilm formation